MTAGGRVLDRCAKDGDRTRSRNQLLMATPGCGCDDLHAGADRWQQQPDKRAIPFEEEKTPGLDDGADANTVQSRASS